MKYISIRLIRVMILTDHKYLSSFLFEIWIVNESYTSFLIVKNKEKSSDLFSLLTQEIKNNTSNKHKNSSNRDRNSCTSIFIKHHISVVDS
jgi:hypothetical protein